MVARLDGPARLRLHPKNMQSPCRARTPGMPNRLSRRAQAICGDPGKNTRADKGNGHGGGITGGFAKSKGFSGGEVFQASRSLWL